MVLQVVKAMCQDTKMSVHVLCMYTKNWYSDEKGLVEDTHSQYRMLSTTDKAKQWISLYW